MRGGSQAVAWAAIGATLSTAGGPATAYAQAQPGASSARDPVAACDSFKPSTNFSPMAERLARIPDAPTNVVSARVVAPERGLPEYCRVEGLIAPTIGFVVKLPTHTWNGKLLMGGCGGPCGYLPVDRLDPPLARNYAVVTTDMGHRGTGWAFLYQNMQGAVDFGSRATHLTAVTAKAIVEAYYGQAANETYFDGCSTGGRQAMVEAQRFPDDFNGIVGGAPPYDEIGDTPLFLSWGARANIDAQGRPILDAAKLPMIHKAVMDSCATKADGPYDVLQNPAACKWDPRSIICKTGAPAAGCLTPAEAAVVQKIYDGASNSKGRKLYFGMPRGSELGWAPAFVNSDGKPGDYLSGFGGAGNSLMTYGAYFYSRGPTYRETDYDYDRDPARTEVMENFYDARNPDLRAFKAAGGKFILYHGWNDNQIPVGASIDYYQTATRTLGGPAATRDFFRLFLLPGVGHCWGGAGGGDMDTLTALENWVEKGQAPEMILTYKPRTDTYATITTAAGETIVMRPRFPAAPETYVRARPVYAYPAQARWTGKGDPAQPQSWVKAER